MLIVIGSCLIAIGSVYLLNPNLFRRGIWLKTSVAIRTLSPENYVKYIRALGFICIIVGTVLVILGLK